jgi:hypothetical protein
MLYLLESARQPISLLRSALIVFTMSPLSHDLKTHILRLVLADVLNKQRIKFINPDILSVCWKERNITRIPMQRVTDPDTAEFSERVGL